MKEKLNILQKEKMNKNEEFKNQNQIIEINLNLMKSCYLNSDLCKKMVILNLEV